MRHSTYGPVADVRPSARAGTVALYAAGALCLAIPFALVAIYSLNLFYGTGAVFWDMGLFAHFAAFSDAWPMPWPDFLHRNPGPRPTFFSIHLMPIFYLTSALHKLVPFLPPAAWLSVLQGLWAGLIGLAVFMLCARPGTILIALLASLGTALCGPMLAAVGFPHVELAIPALFLMFFALRSARHRVGSYAALLLCFAVREDAGFHVAGALLLLAGAQWLSGRASAETRENVSVAIVGLMYSLTAVTLQHLGFPTELSQLERMYLGEPAFAHLTLELIYDRCIEFSTGRAYAIWPLVLVTTFAIWKRDLALAAGALASIPWILLHLLAVAGQGLGGHYAFPLILAIAWPAVVLGPQGVRMQLLVSAVSIFLFAAIGGVNLDRAPWRSLDTPNLPAIGLYERTLRQAAAHRGQFGRLMMDGAVISLVPEAAALDEWTAQWAVDNLPDPDVVIYLPAARDRIETEKLLAQLDLVHRCTLPDTPFVVASRSGTSLCP